MWYVYDDDNNKQWEFNSKEEMLEFLDSMNDQGLVKESWYVEYDYFDRSKRNDRYPISDFVYFD